MNVLGGLACAGDGTGGESIYGLTFEDEIVARLSHDRMGVVSMVSLGGFCAARCLRGMLQPRLQEPKSIARGTDEISLPLGICSSMSARRAQDFFCVAQVWRDM